MDSWESVGPEGARLGAVGARLGVVGALVGSRGRSEHGRPSKCNILSDHDGSLGPESTGSLGIGSEVM